MAFVVVEIDNTQSQLGIKSIEVNLKRTISFYMDSDTQTLCSINLGGVPAGAKAMDQEKKQTRILIDDPKNPFYPSITGKSIKCVY